jgi:putative isomerase
MLKFDVTRIPFSRAGSYMGITRWPKSAHLDAGLYLRNLRGDAPRSETLLLELTLGGKPVPFAERASPDGLCLVPRGKGGAELCLAHPRQLRLRTTGPMGLRLSAEKAGFNNSIPWDGPDSWLVNIWNGRIRYMLRRVRGQVSVDAPWIPGRSKHVIIDMGPGSEAVLEDFVQDWQPLLLDKSFAQARTRVKGDFSEFHSRMPTVPARLRPAAELAAYVMWSCLVAAEGTMPRTGMFMSKNWMLNVWSWDHCFNALALARGLPDLAWDQLMVMFDLQDPESGALPDSVNARLPVWNFTKPPIHGWALHWMLRNARVSRARLEEAYPRLAEWTLFWLERRDFDRDGIANYTHGNDSGWDNASVFDLGGDVEGPDLSSYLVLQMDTLAELARRLGKKAEAAAWKRRADGLLDRLLSHSWDGRRFRALRSGSHEEAPGNSLFNFLPLILGKRLPKPVFQTMVRDLSTRGLLTRWGLATEAPKSPKFEVDGYWRGPIWAPPTLQIVDGLRRGGEVDLSADIARRFCALCAKSGMAENFNPLTGAGLRDPAYTWTASAFLVLASGYL